MGRAWGAHPTDIGVAARQRDSADRPSRTCSVTTAGSPSPRSPAKQASPAGSSMPPGLRERIDQARARQAAQGHEDQQSGRKVSIASEQTGLLLARQEIKQLRTENGQLRQHPHSSRAAGRTARQPRPGRPHQRAHRGEPATLHGGTTGEHGEHTASAASRRARGRPRCRPHQPPPHDPQREPGLMCRLHCVLAIDEFGKSWGRWGPRNCPKASFPDDDDLRLPPTDA